MVNNKVDGVYNVTATSGIFSAFIVNIIMFVSEYYLLHSSYWFIGIILFILQIIMFFELLVSLKGTTIDTNNRTMTFAARGLSANTVLQSLSPFWLFRMLFGMVTIDLDSLNDLEYDSETKFSYDENEKMQSKTAYYVRFSGGFGSAYIKFVGGVEAKQKSMQLFGLIRSSTGMGVPIV